MASQKSPELAGRSRTHIYAVIGALLAFAASVLVPTATITNLKLLPTNATFIISSTPSMSTMYNPAADCDPEGPRGCFVIDTETHMEREVQLTPATDEDNVELRAHTTLLRSDDEHTVLSVDDNIELIRNSTYPVTDTASALKVSASDFSVLFATGNFTRDGIQYFFPFETEKRSYDFFDALAQKTIPLDYVEENNNVYTFTQHIQPKNLLDAATRSYTHPTSISDEFTGEPSQTDLTDQQRDTLRDLMVHGAAHQFYPDNVDLLGNSVNGAVVLKPYYQGWRTLTVDRYSGTILNQEEETFIFLAQNDEEAAATSSSFSENPNLIAQDTDLRARTLLHIHTQWDELTQQTAREHAKPTADTLSLLRIFAFICQLIGLALLIFGLWRYNRIRKA